MRDRKEDRNSVLSDLRNHRMAIEHETDLHRCLYFGKPGTGNMHFRIITWPGALAIEGDMGAFTFRRLRDMFEFFRSDDGEITVNLGYWAEKLVAVGRHEPFRVYDEDIFEDCVRDAFKNDMRFDSQAARYAAWQNLIDPCDGLLGRDFYNAQEALDAAFRYQCRSTGKEFQDVPDWGAEDWGYHFVWCCHAIVWAIKRYDQHTTGCAQWDHDRSVLKGKI